MDGAYFGCSFPHIFLQTYPDLMPSEGANTYIPRIYGFKIYKKKGSKFYEQNKGTKNLTYFGEETEKDDKNKKDQNIF